MKVFADKHKQTELPLFSPHQMISEVYVYKLKLKIELICGEHITYLYPHDTVMIFKSSYLYDTLIILYADESDQIWITELQCENINPHDYFEEYSGKLLRERFDRFYNMSKALQRVNFFSNNELIFNHLFSHDIYDIIAT